MVSTVQTAERINLRFSVMKSVNRYRSNETSFIVLRPFCQFLTIFNLAPVRLHGLRGSGFSFISSLF